jgi:starch synthase
MKIAFVSSEVFPFSKTGGLADVVGALSKETAELGNDVIVLTPLYKSVFDKFSDKIVNTNKKVWVDVPNGLVEFELWATILNKVKFIFFKNEGLFFRQGFYNENGFDYPDNYFRFATFSMAVMNYLKHHDIEPDIIHCNDWQTALIPVYHKSFFNDIKTKTILTIHNLAFQGIFDINLTSIGLDNSFLIMSKLEFYGKTNYLKGGIVYSDFVTTVSPTYAEEIKTPEYGFGLDGLLKYYDYKLIGILNGIDYEYWNPLTDKLIYENYNTSKMKNKNKSPLTKEFSLNDNPLFVMVSRFAEQKGINMILDIGENFNRLNANFIFLGDGTPDFNNKMKNLESLCRNVKVILGYNEELSHKLYSAADFYLMPSIFEPCGLSQMIAMRYGALPVVRKTGGLNDTVKDLSLKEGYGFVFEEAKSDSLLFQINRAIDFYSNIKFDSYVNFVMKIDFSWKKSAKKYLKIYQNL